MWMLIRAFSVQILDKGLFLFCVSYASDEDQTSLIFVLSGVRFSVSVRLKYIRMKFVCSVQKEKKKKKNY